MNDFLFDFIINFYEMLIESTWSSFRKTDRFLLTISNTICCFGAPQLRPYFAVLDSMHTDGEYDSPINNWKLGKMLGHINVVVSLTHSLLDFLLPLTWHMQLGNSFRIAINCPLSTKCRHIGCIPLQLRLLDCHWKFKYIPLLVA